MKKNFASYLQHGYSASLTTTKHYRGWQKVRDKHYYIGRCSDWLEKKRKWKPPKEGRKLQPPSSGSFLPIVGVGIGAAMGFMDQGCVEGALWGAMESFNPEPLPPSEIGDAMLYPEKQPPAAEDAQWSQLPPPDSIQIDSDDAGQPKNVIFVFYWIARNDNPDPNTLPNYISRTLLIGTLEGHSVTRSGMSVRLEQLNQLKADFQQSWLGCGQGPLKVCDLNAWFRAHL